MIKKVAKRILPKVAQDKIRYLIMLRHKRNCIDEENKNEKLQFKKDFEIIKKRKAIYNSANIEFNTRQKELVYKLTNTGLFFGKLDDYYVKTEDMIKYLTELATPMKGKTLEEAENEHLKYEQSYNAHSKGNFVNLYHPKKNISDPIKEFLTDPQIFTMAARYLGEIPQVMMVQFLFTPNKNLDPKGPMLWHLDRQSDNSFRMFINPFEMTKENGATKAFPSKYHKDDYYKTYPYFSDKEAEENGFDLNDIVHLVGGPGMFGVVDTCTNFHCGSISEKERFVTIMTFVPYQFKGSYNADNLIGDRDLFEKENKIIYDYFKNNSNIED